MSRAEELKNLFKDCDEGKRVIAARLIEEAAYLEEQLTELKTYKHIKIHPKNPNLQKITAAGKQYREYLQTYTNIIRALERMLASEVQDEDDPIQQYFKMKNERLKSEQAQK